MSEAVHVAAVGAHNVIVVDVPAVVDDASVKDLARAVYRADRACGDVDDVKAVGVVVNVAGGGYAPAVYGYDRAAFSAFVDDVEAVCLQLFSLRVPVVAALSGDVRGMGAILALAADERVAPLLGSFSFVLDDVRLGLPLASGALEIARFALPPSSWNDVLLRSQKLGRGDAFDKGVVVELAANVTDAAKDRVASFGGGAARALQKTKLDLRHDALTKARARAIESRRIVVEHFFDPLVVARRSR